MSWTAAVRELDPESGATVYMVLLDALSTLLVRLSGQEEVIIGSPAAGRPHAELKGMLGMFVSTLALRTYPAGEKIFAAYLQEVRQTALEAFEHGDYPFEELVEQVVRQRDTAATRASTRCSCCRTWSKRRLSCANCS
nr:condensation domain-containing protein [Paenibacillus thiaminolyticus]